MTEPIDNDELTAHFAVPRELLDKLRDDDDDATRVGPLPAGLLEDEQTREIPADPVHSAPTLPPPAPAAAPPASPRQATPAGVRVVFPRTSDAELHAQVRAMLRPQRIARGLFVTLLVLVAAVVLVWCVLSP